MSSIDQRIVEMQFNNQRFEQGIQTSLKSLDSLKKGLDLKDAGRGLMDLERAARSFTLSSIADSVNAVSNKFSALGVMATTTLMNITNSAVNAGKRIVNSLTMEPVNEGFKEYEMILTATQTTMAGTGKSLEYVEGELKKLDEYADKTIYSTGDMLQNLPKFTNAGVDLEKAVTAMKGIANATALAGGGAQQASSAFYNLGQSIGGGYLTRMDYNSLNLAGSATMEWKKRMVEAAIAQKSLTKVGEDQYKVDGKLFTLQSLFIEGLQERWATSDVLMKVYGDYGDVTTDIGKKAQAAAQDIKSFSMLMESLKASVVTGWKDTWQLLFGDINEAKAFWTPIGEYVSDAFGKATKARNDILQVWRDEGGHIAFFDGFKNAVEGVEAVLKPIGEAFRQIFPPITGIQLVEFSQNFRDLMETFKIGEETADKVKRTFAGVFAILDIGKMAVSALVKAFINIVKYISPVGGSFLEATAGIGDFFVKLDAYLKKTDGFNKALEKISSVVKPFADGIKQTLGKAGEIIKYFFDIITDKFKAIGSIDTSGLDKFTENMKNRFTPIGIIGKVVEKAIMGIVAVFKFAYPILSFIGTEISKVFGNFIDAIANAFTGGGNKSIVDMINTGMFATMLVSVRRFINSMTTMTSGVGGILKGVTGSLTQLQNQLKAATLMKIAIAMGILTASIIALSLVDPEKLTYSLGAMTTMFVQLFGSMAAFEKIMGSAGFVTMGKLTAAMIALSIAILLLTVSVTRLSALNWNDLAKGLTGVIALTGMLIGVAKLLDKNTAPIIKASIGFTILGVALLILTQSVKQLGSMDLEDLAKGLIGLGIVMGELIGFLALMEKVKNAKTMAVSLTILGVALNLMAMAISKLGNLSWEELGRGLLGMAGALAILIGVLYIMPKNIATTGGAFVILAVALNLIAAALVKIGSLSWNDLAKGMTGIVVTIGAIATALTLMDAALPGAAAILIVAPALIMLSKALIMISVLSWEDLAKGISGIALSMAILATALTLMDAALPGAAAILIVAPALIMLSKALIMMSVLSWEGIAKGLTMLAGTMTILGVALSLMSASIPGAAAILIVAGALAVLAPVLATFGNMSMAEIGKSLLMLAGVFGVFGLAGVVLGPLIPVLLGLSAALALLGIGLLAIGGGVLAFATGMGMLAVSGAAGAAALVVAITSIIGILPLVVKSFAQAILDLTTYILKGLPTIIKALEKIVVAILDLIIEITPKIGKALTELVINLLKFLDKTVPQFIKTGWNLLIAFLEGFAENIEKVIDAAVSICLNFIKGIASQLGKIIQAGVDMVLNFINGVSDAIEKNTDPLIKAMDRLIQTMIDAGIKLITGSARTWSTAIKKIVKVISEKVSDFKKAGKNLIEGLIKGMKGMVKDVVNIGANIGSSVLRSAKKALGIKSPSKEFEKIGKFSIEGFIKGIKEETPKAEKAVKTSMDAMREAQQKSKKEMDEEANETSTTSYDVMRASQKKTTEQIEKEQTKAVKKEETKAKEEVKVTQKANDKKVEDAKTTSAEIKTVQETQVKTADELRREEFENTKKWIDDEKYYNRLSLEQEYATWENIHNKMLEGTEERKEAEREMYRVQNELRRDSFEKSKKWIETEVYYNRLPLTSDTGDSQLKAWTRVRDRNAYGTDEYIEAAKEIYRIEGEIYNAGYNFSKNWIETEKYYKRLPLTEELAAWKRVNSRYKWDSDEYKESAKELYRVEGEIEAANKDHLDKLNTLQKNFVAEQQNINMDYYYSVTSINNKLADDVDALTKQYEDAVKSRSDAIMSSYSLFEKVPEAETEQVKDLAGNLLYWTDAAKEATTTAETSFPVMQEISGKTLTDNLRGQVNQLKAFEASISQLRKSGLSEDLIDELEQMGPKSVSQIQAFNRMSKYELSEYDKLWQEKRSISTSEAIKENEGLRVATVNAITDLKTDASTELEKVTKTWLTNTAYLRLQNDSELAEIRKSYYTTTCKIDTEVNDNFKNMIEGIHTTFSTTNWILDWRNLGGDVIRGFAKGVADETGSALEASENAMNAATTRAADTLGVASPSKVFARLGEFAMLGFAKGLSNNLTPVKDQTVKMAVIAKDALTQTLSNFDALVTDENRPTIRPVIDMTDVNKGLDSTFNQSRGINTYETNRRAALMAATSKSNESVGNGTSNTTNNTTSDNRIILNVNYSVRNESDIRKTSESLNNTLHKFNRSRGVPV